MNSNNNSNNKRSHVFHTFRHFPNLKIGINQAEKISKHHHNHNNNTNKLFYDTTFRIGNTNTNTNTNTDRPDLYHIEKELKTLKKSSIEVLKADMNRFRTALVHNREKVRSTIKEIIKTKSRPNNWNDDTSQSVSEKLMNIGIDINDNTLISLLNDYGDEIYNWKDLQQSMYSHLGIKITNEEAQLLLIHLVKD